MEDQHTHQGAIAWMARNTVAANLVMLLFLVGGFLMSARIQQEIFPEVDLDLVRITVPYPGASPEEVEQGIILAIEDEVRGVEDVKRVTSTALEGEGVVSVELLRGADSGKALQDVKNAVDRIQSFPEEIERPIISLVETRKQVISIVLYGDQERNVLRNLAEKVRDDLIQLDGITYVELGSVPPLEIAIEVPQKWLRSYNLTLDEISNIVRRSALELPGGAVKAPGGEILLRTKERRDYASEFLDIPIVSNPDGTKVQLGDIAEVIEGFEDTDQESYFNGLPAIKVDVFRVGRETPLDVADIVKQYVKELRATLPPGVSVATWNDRSEIFADRIGLLLRNAMLGLCLVLFLLGIFLEPRLAFWVTLGIPVSIIGSFLFIPIMGATINMVSLFAFIVTLGIIVDDAIVVGENIYQKREQGMSYIDAAVEGAQEISMPVFFAVITNIIAFCPLFFVPGSTGKIFLQIPAIVVSVFLISLVESLYVLPAHLSIKHVETSFWRVLRAPSRYFNIKLTWFIENVYRKHALFSIQHRYLTVSIAIGILILAIGTVASGFIQFSYLPRVDSDLVTAQAVLPFGVPIEESRKVQQRLVDAAKAVIKSQKEDATITRGIYTQIGTNVGSNGPTLDAFVSTVGSHLVGVQVFLVPSNQRGISGIEFARIWRDFVGEIPGLESLSFDATIQAGEGAPIDIELSHRDRNTLETAAQDLASYLRQYKGIRDLNDGVNLGKPQLNFKLKPEARSLGLTTQDLARQLRWAFYGSESLRQQRGRNEVKVMVRLPEEDRETIYTVEELILLTPTGGEIPLSEAAEISPGHSYTDIKRSDGQRVIAVTADVEETEANANQIIADIKEHVMPKLEQKYPGLSYTLEGQQRAQRESLEALGYGFIFALVAIYAMLAIPFRSYVQPFVVMLSIPFGIIGAIIGHILLGYELSIISMFGIIALSGVVVNDSLVFIVTTNRLRWFESYEAIDALLRAGTSRFRPILLTSLTTFFGLSPMIFETSMQARFLIPMAVSLGFGILFATFIILLLVPAVYMIIEDIKKLIHYEEHQP
ncbi:MAG: efflux RND transporter permease subunit [Chlamydiales bacterium]|nr:efflux RND transporter permease subunit [Chlamydiia bacterium]MCP5508544.1 efflux RND transporter permease subunit [Chlamydiales bacterium]